MHRFSNFSQIPEVVKNLLIINVLLFLATISFESIDLTKYLGLYQMQSESFRPHQLITHMFMHGNFAHLFFNMFALWMFGRVLENVWGGKKFLIYYMITGLGAMILYSTVQQVQISALEEKMTSDQITQVASEEGYKCYQEMIWQAKNGKQEFNNVFFNSYEIHTQNQVDLLSLYYSPVVGASGAVFGLLLAFGVLFANTKLFIYVVMLFFIIASWVLNLSSNFLLYVFVLLILLGRIFPDITRYIWKTVPVKAKYFVIIYGLLELYLGLINSPTDNIAHFAHLGGMLFGFLLIRYWKKETGSFY